MMTIAEAIAVLLQLTQTATNMMSQATAVSALIQQANAQGRTTFTDAEWATIKGADDQARAALVAALTKALGGA